MQIYRSTFGRSRCEIFLHQYGGTRVIAAWALLIRPDGRLDPLSGEDGRAVQARADNFEDALVAMKRRLVVLLGEESVGPETDGHSGP